MVSQIDGCDVRPLPGRLVQPDGWQWAMPLTPSDWEQAAFRLPSARYNWVRWAVNVEVTGRTIRNGRVRVKITFVGDGEPDTTHHGWMTLTA